MHRARCRSHRLSAIRPNSACILELGYLDTRTNRDVRQRGSCHLEDRGSARADAPSHAHVDSTPQPESAPSRHTHGISTQCLDRFQNDRASGARAECFSAFRKLGRAVLPQDCQANRDAAPSQRRKRFHVKSSRPRADTRVDASKSFMDLQHRARRGSAAVLRFQVLSEKTDAIGN